MRDTTIENLLNLENNRQHEGLELIASENYVSDDVLTALGSIATNKYAEGYPGHRYYGGCDVIDKIEQLAIDRVCQLYDCTYANVQPHSGSQANRAAIEAVCNIGDTILSLNLNNGGHLTHGSPVSFSGKYYNIISYDLTSNDRIDYDDLLNKAKEYMPKLIIAGASAYSREWDYEQLVIAKNLSYNAQVAAHEKNPRCTLMFDMAHTAGLIAAKLMKNPCDYCDIVTSTTHKTLRGPRGGIILAKKDIDNPKGEKKKDGTVKKLSEVINSSVFPGNQGGPLENTIAAKAVCFYEALQPEFIEYQKSVIENTYNLAKCFKELGYKIVSDGTDNHLFLIDLRENFSSITGKDAEFLLGTVGITVNKNMVPNDNRSPFTTSGLRIGTAAITSRGIKDMKFVANTINQVLSLYSDGKLDEVASGYKTKTNREVIKDSVYNFCKKYPLRKDI